ncbi:hypothetical protein [Thermogemmatispora tikiterensis]|uniref:NfeD-like C-terminal domain-containing protein n=1 Tax=Thermogemmatispora tikiterensis TaxID=1825093 RepID=A0A328VCN9_9CHLR|nr:hypothetical protein [Thermogemmatispora tikiterensis]RAQ95377.1 hypothetical protein A4R35_07500 [Thermogemmatispora tikiterensis]
MVIATDPLSLVFIGCFLFGTFFLVISALLGGLGHGLAHHAGGLASHASTGPHGLAQHVHLPHLHPGSADPQAHVVSEVSQGSQAPASTHTGHASPSGQPSQPSQVTSALWFSHLLTFVNPWSVIFFLLGFGFFGYVFHNATHLDVLFSLLLALITGLLLAGLVLALLFRIFGDSEAETIQDVSDRTGLIGKVSLPIRQNSIGEVIYVSPGGLRKSVPARSVDGQPIERGQEVIILHYEHGIAEVETWERFFEGEPGQQPLRTPTGAELEQLRTLLQDQDGNDRSELLTGKDLL